jgi:TatD DNase family protein
MNLLDVHAHLESSKFKKDLDKIIENAKEKQVKLILNSGTSPKRNRESLELSKRFPLIKCSFGWYPIGNLTRDQDEEIVWINNHKEDCVAIGEIGLDFEEESANDKKKEQSEMFEKMILLAKNLNKPVIVHSRKAELEAIKILEKHKIEKVVMHCFCGDSHLINRCIQNKWYLSVPPAVIRWNNFKELIKITPLENLLTETDAPYLSYVRGERNEPANVAVTIKEIARIKGLTEEEVAEKIWKNWEKLVDK